MTKLILIFSLMIAHADKHGAHRKPAQEAWRNTGFETLRLPKPVSEGVTFTRAQNEANRTAYEIVYFLGEKVVRKNGLPNDVYQSIKQKLQTTVFDLSPKDVGQPCPNRIFWESGTLNPNTSTTTGYCLNRVASEAFATWYKSVMQLLF